MPSMLDSSGEVFRPSQGTFLTFAWALAFGSFFVFLTTCSDVSWIRASEVNVVRHSHDRQICAYYTRHSGGHCRDIREGSNPAEITIIKAQKP